MMKNCRGVTLTILMSTVLIIIILVGVSVEFGYSGIANVRNDKYATELATVQQAVLQQYQMAKAVNKTEKGIDEEQVTYWVGKRISDSSEKIDLPEKSEITVPPAEGGDKLYLNSEKYDYKYQEEYYYRLEQEDLAEIGILDSKEATYVVNYSTGEVYNESRKINSSSQLLYLPSVKYEDNKNDEIGDETSFNDWAE